MECSRCASPSVTRDNHEPLCEEHAEERFEELENKRDSLKQAIQTAESEDETAKRQHELDSIKQRILEMESTYEAHS